MTTPNESRAFEVALQKCGTTADGAKWLKLAVDPFHDVDLDLIGFPDQAPGRSVIYNVTKNVTVSAPSTATGRWDAHVAFIPHVAAKPLEAYNPSLTSEGAIASIQNNNVGPGGELTYGLITVDSVPEGESTFVGSANAEQDVLTISDVLDNDGSSLFRVIGCAFEVHNVTEELHKSGSVTTYRHDTHSDDLNLHFQDTDATITSVQHNMDVFTGPPSSEASAKILNGITWEAAEGCLVPAVLTDVVNDPQKSMPRYQGMLTTAPDNSGLLTCQKSVCATDLKFSPSLEAIGDRTVELGCSTIIPYMQSGAYFTGLSNETSLTVTMRCFVEVFPNPSNPLVPLAHPTPAYDSEALMCYSKIMHDLHSGYPVRDNAAGDFFKKALSAVRMVLKTSKPVLKAASVLPVVGPTAAKISGGMDVVEGLIPPSRRRRARK